MELLSYGAPTILLALLVFGFAPGLALRLIVLLFRKDDPRRRELVAELYAVPRWDQPFWVAQHLELALMEALLDRAWLARNSLPARFPLPVVDASIREAVDRLHLRVAPMLGWKGNRWVKTGKGTGTYVTMSIVWVGRLGRRAPVIEAEVSNPEVLGRRYAGRHRVRFRVLGVTIVGSATAGSWTAPTRCTW